MVVRIEARRLILLAILGIILTFVLILPFVLYTRSFISSFRASQEKWATYGSGSYEIVVASNSLTECTGGWNTIVIKDGEVVEGRNAERDECSLTAFDQLTVETLFARIWDECIRNHSLRKPFPVCNVNYDEQLGFPRRLDTYTFTAEGSYLPSITVNNITLHP